MKRPAFRVSAVTILEEGFALLRECPPRILLRYYVGAMPFVLASCGYVLDLSRNPAAEGRSGAWAVVMAVLYLWLKLWHAGFAGALRAELGDDGATRAGGRLAQTARYLGWQGLAPWSLAVAALATVPFGWIYAFFHALSVTGDARRAWSQARHWPRQNHLLVGILFLLACVVAANVVGAVLMLPALLDSVLGIETAASQDPASLFNSTLLVVALGASYLLVGPVAKAAYVLRAYYGDSKATGEDLKSRLRALARRGAPICAAMLLSAPMLLPAAQDPGPAGIDSAALDEALDRELEHPDYDWLRLQGPASLEHGFVARLMERALDGIETALDWLGKLVEKVVEWLREGRENEPARGRRDGLGPLSPRLLVVLASLLVLAGLIYVLTRRDSDVPGVLPAASDQAAMEAALAQSDALADRMPYDEWLETARRLMAAGDARLAARAAYLATLSFLAHSGLLLLADHKSNREYRSELEVRGHVWPALSPTFADSVRVIERVWYGTHLAGDGELDRLTRNLETMRGLHEAG